MAIPEGHKTNLETIKRAAKNGDLAVLECTEKASGKSVHVLVAVAAMVADTGDMEYQMTPLAKLFDGNPYDELDPPT